MKPFNLQKFLSGEPITTLGGHQVVAFRYDTNFNDIFPLTVAIKDNTGLISSYQYSIDGEPLGTIDSNYILCMKDTELSINNNKQQTAVDKAKELIEKMTKQYALIAVDEIINVTAGLKGWIDGFQYWEEVKKEIETYEGGEQ
jgi:hypothetical protein